MTSFLQAIPSFLKIIPDAKLDSQLIIAKLKVKCRVLYFAMNYPVLGQCTSSGIVRGDVLHIVWPHRW